MSIRTKIIVIVTALFTCLGVVDAIVQRAIIFPSFLKLEHHEAGENIRRIMRSIDREQFHLNKMCYDWATWNDTFEFVDTLSESYVESNLMLDTFTSNRLNLLYIFRNDGTMAWGRAIDLESEAELPLAILKSGRLDPSHPFLALDPDPSEEGRHGRSGVIMTAHGPMLFAALSVLRSDRSGPSNGVIVMGRIISSEVVNSLREQTRIDFRLSYPLDHAALDQQKKNHTTHADADLTYYSHRGEQFIDVWTVYADTLGEPAFSISYNFPREITKKGLTSIRYALLLIAGAALVILVILIISLQTVVVNPLKKLNDYASRLDREGDYSIRVNLNRRDETGQLARTLEMMVATIAQRTEALKTANEKLKQLSNKDGLTGIANRRLFDVTMDREWRRMIRQRAPLSLILADVDYFKRYNDMHGHQEGDNCLVAVARTIAGSVKRPADLTARYGGEEFAVILPDTDTAGAFHVAEQIRQAVLDMRIIHKGSEIAEYVTLSLGVNTMVPRAEDDMPTFVQKTDQALYQAKKAGRNQSLTSSGRS